MSSRPPADIGTNPAVAVAPPTVESVPERIGRAADVGLARERRRQRRLGRLGLILAVVAGWLWFRLLTGDPVGMPRLPQIDPLIAMSAAFYLVLTVAMLATTVVSGRSPHVLYRPEQIDVRFADVKGLGPVTEEVRRSLDLFLSARTYRQAMGGTPRRGLLFEGPPGTGKTHLAKAMAAEAGVPFLYVSATSFQSSFYGATSRRIRSYFAALRAAARAEGGAIGFIEEIDAIGASRSGVSGSGIGSAAGPVGGRLAGCGGLVGLQFPALISSPPAPGSTAVAFGTATDAATVSSDVGAVVNELLVQMQSFDSLTTGQRVLGRAVGAVNLLLPAHRALPAPRPQPLDILLVAATNRADSLDPALLRPGRFDRRLSFTTPDKAGRRELVDLFLSRKAHEAALQDPDLRDALAGMTQGYSPAMLENLFDEALVNAVRRNSAQMSWADLEHARLTAEVGLGQPVGYTAHEERLIATHEAGHAVTAWLVAPTRRLEVLTIIKRAGSLGLLAHGDTDEVYTRSRRELEGLIRIAFGGQVAEELFVGDISTGPGGDLAYATTVAVQMVGEAGMAGSLISYAAVSPSLTDPGLAGRVLADPVGRRQVEDLLVRQRAATRALLQRNAHLVTALRDALIERHELIGREITDVLTAAAQAHPATARTGPAQVDVREAVRPSTA